MRRLTSHLRELQAEAAKLDAVVVANLKELGMAGKLSVIPAERIEKCIFLIPGHKVTLSTHLAELYGVELRALVKAVKRNIERFPGDFMFQLSDEEFAILKSQIVSSS